MTTIGIILALAFLQGWWRVAAIIGLAAFEGLEIWLWLRWRKRRSITGADTMIGQNATVVSPCHPLGQVKARGQLWSARCESGADVGDTVVVTAIRGLKLDVEPVARGALARDSHRPE